MSRSTWHYQPVTMPDGTAGLCEVYLASDGTLRAWTDPQAQWPYGDSVAELAADLRLMLAGVERWVPVPFDDLRPGMVFEMVRQ